MFRNTRTTITGFPRRIACLHALEAPAGQAGLLDVLAEEFTADTDAGAAEYFEPDFTRDPRVDWLADMLRTLGNKKVLLICRTQAKVEELDIALRRRLNVKMAVFHEGLTLVQRDRHAAWFAEDDGARLLLCSEIGSEGRNFQFAHHLVLFDLPLEPELLEQRIGRLDRIGQTSEIRVHVPFVRGGAQEVLARWFHEGLNSFEKNLHGGRELLERFGTRVHDLALEFSDDEALSRPALAKLIDETVVARRELTERLEHGRDRLLELNSFRPDSAARLVKGIAARDADTALERFMVSVFDHFGIQVERLSERTWRLGSAGVFADSFPGLPAEGMTVTCDRQRALSREDVQFLTWDHPLVTGALDLLLGSEKGNSSFALWPDAKSAGLHLEAIFVLECIAPPALHVDRFLPPTPLRVLVDHRGDDVGARLSTEAVRQHLKNGDAYPLIDRPEFREDLLPVMMEKAQALAESRSPAIIAAAGKAMSTQLDGEIARLQELRKANPSVRAEEVALLVQQKAALTRHLNEARLRLDAVRLIRRGPA
jgi:ATP-dependent helicase HepA